MLLETRVVRCVHVGDNRLARRRRRRNARGRGVSQRPARDVTVVSCFGQMGDGAAAVWAAARRTCLPPPPPTGSDVPRSRYSVTCTVVLPRQATIHTLAGRSPLLGRVIYRHARCRTLGAARSREPPIDAWRSDRLRNDRKPVNEMNKSFFRAIHGFGNSAVRR